MTKKRKLSTSLSPARVEVKEENVLGNDYLMAKGRLKGVLKQLTEKSESDSDTSDDTKTPTQRKRKVPENIPTPFRHTYVMKLFDRSVDLAKFEEDTPLYPICRAWMQNQPRNPQLIVKRRLSSPEPGEPASWNSNMMTDIHHLPRPEEGESIARVPSPLPEQKEQNKDNINLDYAENPPVPKEELIRDHLERWVKVKKKWIETAANNEKRYKPSTDILQAIYNRAQEAME